MRRWWWILTVLLGCTGSVILVDAATKSSRCVVVSEAWRGPWNNGTQSDFMQGRKFFDHSIQKCTAFTSECEEWIEFRPDRGQVLCSHEITKTDIYSTAWSHARLLFQAFHHHQDPDALLSSDESHQTGDVVVDGEQHDDGGDDHREEVGSLQHIHLHSSPSTEEPDLEYLLEHNEHVCRTMNVRPIYCRLHTTGEFTRVRDNDRDPLKTGHFLFDMLSWECKTTPDWIHIVEGRPLCPPFYPTDSMSVCVPVEQCVVVIDVEKTHAFDSRSMGMFLMVTIIGIAVLVFVLHRHQNSPHRIRDAFEQRTENHFREMDTWNTYRSARPRKMDQIIHQKMRAALNMLRVR